MLIFSSVLFVLNLLYPIYKVKSIDSFEVVWRNHIYNALTPSIFPLLAHTQNCTFHEFFMRRNWKKILSLLPSRESGYPKQIFATWIIYAMSIAYLLKVLLSPLHFFLFLLLYKFILSKSIEKKKCGGGRIFMNLMKTFNKLK